MRTAIRLSERGFPAPNPRVGCVIVRNDNVVGRGFHKAAGMPHAEALALAQAGELVRGADVYLTLEPCSHHGRTPPCTEALIEAGVGRVIFACEDMNPIARGGAERLRKAGISVVGGFLKDAAAAANEVFYNAMRNRRPYVCIKAAISLDGRIALCDGTSKWITGEKARKAAHRLRAELGCVLVGARTVLNDDPALTVREGIRVINQPARVVLDPERQVTSKRKVFGEGGPTLWLVSDPPAPGQVGLPCTGGEFDLNQVLSMLWERGITGVLVEGGAATISHFIKSGLVDRCELFVAPKLLGSGLTWFNVPGLESLDDAWTFRLDHVRLLDADAQLTLRRQ